MRLFDMMTTEDLKRLKELDNSLSIALDINDKYQRENKDLKERINELENSRSLSTMDEVAYRELEQKHKANLHEIDRLSEENSNLKIIMKGTDGKDSSNNS